MLVQRIEKEILLFDVQNIYAQHLYYSVRNKQLPTWLSRVEFAWGKLKVLKGCPLDNLKFQKIILFYVFII